MRTMNQISMANYFSSIEPKLTDKEAKVLEAIEELYPCTLDMVAEYLAVPPHTISGRITGLKNKRKIAPVGVTKNKNGSTCSMYQPTNTEQDSEDIY